MYGSISVQSSFLYADMLGRGTVHVATGEALVPSGYEERESPVGRLRDREKTDLPSDAAGIHPMHNLNIYKSDF